MSQNETIDKKKHWDGIGIPENGMLVTRVWKFLGSEDKHAECTFIGLDDGGKQWVTKGTLGLLSSGPHEKFIKPKSTKETKNNEFLVKMAALMEEYDICLASEKICDSSRFTKIVFQTKDVDNMFPDLRRCHISPYDLRCLSGMGSKKANELFHKFDAANKISAVGDKKNNLRDPNTCVEVNRQNLINSLNEASKYGDSL